MNQEKFVWPITILAVAIVISVGLYLFQHEKRIGEERIENLRQQEEAKNEQEQISAKKEQDELQAKALKEKQEKDATNATQKVVSDNQNKARENACIDKANSDFLFDFKFLCSQYGLPQETCDSSTFDTASDYSNYSRKLDPNDPFAKLLTAKDKEIAACN